MVKKIINFNIDIESLSLLESIRLNHLFTVIKIYFQSIKQYFDYTPSIEDLEHLRNRGYLIKVVNKTNHYVLREKGEILLKKYVTFTHKESLEERRREIFEKQILQFRDKFKGLRLGSMGTKKAVEQKLRRWMVENPEITYKQILEAVDLYLESLNGDYTYLQRADYFIFKQNTRKEETSRLSLFVEESLKEPENSDWGSEVL